MRNEAAAPLKVGDNVKHKFRENKYQKGTIIAMEEYRLPLVKVLFEDGFYGPNEESEIPYMDLIRI
jgi:hypothetical protein